VTVKVRQVQAAEAGASENEGKKTETEAHREADQIEI
jgi:hypothetical protein